MTIVELPPVACTLASGALKDRLGSIATLNRDALQKYERRDIVLELTYALEARERVHEMVRNERTCCAFLDFDLQETGSEVRLTIRAPETARETADALFEQFVTNAPAPSSCACTASASTEKPASREPAGSKVAGVTAVTLSMGACLRSMLRPAVCTSGNAACGYRVVVGVVRQISPVGHHPRHPLGRGCMGLDCLADAPHASQAGPVDALHDGNGDRADDAGRAVASAREAAYPNAAGLASSRLTRCLERQRMP